MNRPLKTAAILILCVTAVILLVASFSRAVIGAGQSRIRIEDAGVDPDAPATLGAPNAGLSRQEFMQRRADYIGLRRGLDKEHPADPHVRQEAIAMMEAQQQRIASLPHSAETDALTAAWAEIGPSPIPNGQVVAGAATAVSGRTISIAVHPTNPNIVYVGTAQGGLYRSTNGGTTWTPLLDNALSLAIGAIAIAPSQPDTVYVGTGEPNFSADCFFGVGLYRITNASTVTPTISAALNKDAFNQDVFTGASVARIAVDPTNPNNIFVATSFGVGGIGGGLGPSPAYGVYRCTNATAASPVFTRLAGIGSNNFLNITDVVMDPGNPNRIVVAASDPFTVSGAGIYLSTDALAATPTFSLQQPITGTARVELTINRVAATTTVFAASGEGNGRVYRSTDGGSTFITQITNGFCGGQCFYNVAIAVDPGDANRVYLGGTGTTATFAFSTNGGTTFTNSQSGLHTDSHVIAVAPSLPSTVYFGSDGGIYKSTDSGVTWATLNNTTFRATQFMSLAVHPTNQNFTIGGTQDNGTNFYQPAATWTRADFGDGGYSLIDQNATNTTTVRMYHTYFNASTLLGYATVASTALATEGNWTFRGCNGVAGNGIPCGGAVLFYAPLEQGPGNPNTTYYGANILYRSIDAGLNHTAASQNLTNPISAIGISPQDDNVRIVGQRTGGLFGTTTGSAVLTDLDTANAVPNNFVSRAVIDPNNVNTAYVTLSAFGVANVWKTTTLNAVNPTWTLARGTGVNILPQIPVSAFIVDPTNSSVLFAGTDIGVYTSTDGGTNWSPFGTGLPRIAVFDMAIQPSSRTLRIATHGRGLWQMGLPGSLQFTGATSRVFHAGVPFNINLPLTGPSGVECRSNSSAFTIVFNFTNTVTAGTASISSGTATVGSVAFSGTEMRVSLTGVTDGQVVTVSANGVTDTNGTVLPPQTVDAGFLIGDSNGDRSVNAADVTLSRSRSGQTADATNFRSDINPDGTINSADATIQRARSGNFVP